MKARICRVWDCPQKDVPQAVEREESAGEPLRVIAEWLPCGHMVAPPLPVEPAPPRPQYGALGRWF